jgi:hypothetical protein
MGTPVSVSYSNGFMVRRFDTSLLRKWAGEILLFKRFLDDVLIILRSRRHLPEFLSSLNQTHPALQLTTTVSDHHADFLDLHLFKGERFAQTGKLDSKVHQKALHKYLYLPFRSYHPWPVKTGFIRTELQRYVRNCTSQADFIEIRRQFYYRLRDRGFPGNVIVREFNSVHYSDRTALLQHNPEPKSHATRPVVFKSVHNPTYASVHLRRLLTEHWHLLAPLANVFASQPVIAVSREKNLKDLLCRARL